MNRNKHRFYPQILKFRDHLSDKSPLTSETTTRTIPRQRPGLQWKEDRRSGMEVD